MKKLLNGCFIAFVIWILFVTHHVLGGSLTFGNGMGDLGWLIVPMPLLLLFSILIWYIARRNKSNIAILISVIYNLATIAYLLYSLTIGRGPELPWNGHFFIH